MLAYLSYKNPTIFTVQSGHKRKFLTMDDLVFNGFSNDKFIQIKEGEFNLPFGPAMPSKYNQLQTINEVMASESNTDLIRQFFCQNFKGKGYEIGAGDRPTCIPSDIDITYLDKFDYADTLLKGSFKGKKFNENFVSFVYEDTQILKSVKALSADFFILCHVIEHLPNPLLAIRKIFEKLKKGGSVFMVIPLKDFTFDSKRPLTTIYHLVNDFLYYSRPNDLQHYFEYLDLVSGSNGWLNDGRNAYKNNEDLHYHVFDSKNFNLLIEYSKTLDPWESIKIYAPKEKSSLAEFYCLFKK